jgi:FAD/FMN-containing dehydrogenase
MSSRPMSGSVIPAGIIPAGVLAGLRQALGPAGFLDAATDIAPYLEDVHRRYHGASVFVARPGTRDQVVEVVKICARNGVGIVPHGGNTGYCGGATPSSSGKEIILSLQRMNRVRDVDAAGYAMTVEAGCTLQQVQNAAGAADRLFPLSLGSQGSCQIGGNLSTNAGGTAVLRYGMIRELVLGLEVVLPDGRVLDQLRALRKDNTGYDVKQLFIGAEGTLGIITAACLKLFPQPAAHATALLAVDDLQRAVQLLGHIRDELGDSTVAFEVIPRIAVELATKHIAGVVDPFDRPHPWYVLTEISLSRATAASEDRFAEFLSNLIERKEILDAVIAVSEAQRMGLWHLRERIPEAQSREGASLKHDISLSIAAIPEFVATASAAAAKIAPGARVFAYGHLGDGNLHFNFSQPPDESAATFLARGAALSRLVHDLVAQRHGSFSAEHGIGKSKVQDLVRYEDPVALELMRKIKAAIDPQDLMNPGKVIEP